MPCPVNETRGFMVLQLQLTSLLFGFILMANRLQKAISKSETGQTNAWKVNLYHPSYLRSYKYCVR